MAISNIKHWLLYTDVTTIHYEYNDVTMCRIIHEGILLVTPKSCKTRKDAFHNARHFMLYHPLKDTIIDHVRILFAIISVTPCTICILCYNDHANHKGCYVILHIMAEFSSWTRPWYVPKDFREATIAKMAAVTCSICNDHEMGYVLGCQWP